MPTLSQSTVQQMAYAAGFRGSALDTIVAIAGAESGYNPDAQHYNTNRTWDLGLLQINATAWPLFHSYYDPQAELDYAYSAISRQGSDFTAWSTYNSGAYRSFMPAGTSGGSTAGNIAGSVAGNIGNMIPGSGIAGDLAGGAVGGAASSAVSGVTGAVQDAFTNIAKWVLPHLILLGGATLALILILHELTRGMPVPVPV